MQGVPCSPTYYHHCWSPFCTKETHEADNEADTATKEWPGGGSNYLRPIHVYHSPVGCYCTTASLEKPSCCGLGLVHAIHTLVVKGHGRFREIIIALPRWKSFVVVRRGWYSQHTSTREVHVSCYYEMMATASGNPLEATEDGPAAVVQLLCSSLCVISYPTGLQEQKGEKLMAEGISRLGGQMALMI